MVQIITGVILILAVLALYVCGIYKLVQNWKKYKRKKYVKQNNKKNNVVYYREIPNKNNTAAGVAFLTKKLNNLIYRDNTNTLNKVIQATILELSLKGHIEIKNETGKNTIIRIIDCNRENLKKSQITILEFIKTLMGSNDEISIPELKKSIKANKQLYRDTFKNEFVEEIIQEQIELGNCSIDQKDYNKLYKDFMTTIITIVAIVFISMILIIIPFGNISVNIQCNIPINLSDIMLIIIGIIILLPTIFAIILACKIAIQLVDNRKIIYKDSISTESELIEKKRVFYYDILAFLTEQGKEEKENWLSLKKYLKEYTLMKDYDIKTIEINEEYLVYATLFGIANDIQKELGGYSSMLIYWDEISY